MRISRIKAVFAKEFVDIIRDRRTLIAMIGVPIALYPILMLAALQTATSQVQGIRQEQIVIAVPDEVVKNDLVQRIKIDSIVPLNGRRHPIDNDEIDLDTSEPKVTSDVVAAVVSGNAEVGLIPLNGKNGYKFENGFMIVVDDAEVRSQIAAERIESFLDRWSIRIRQKVYEERGLPQDFAAPIPVDHQNVGSADKMGGAILAMFLPLVLVLMTVTSAIYPAIDMSAGERERGTLEVLMASPVPVEDLIIGKFLVVTVLSLIAASINLLSIGLTTHFSGIGEILGEGTEMAVPFAVLPLILLTMIPFAVLFSAVLLAVASSAKTFKEAQNYMVPVILAAMIPGMAASLPGTELKGAMIIMPVGNMVLLARELLLGHLDDLGPIIMVIASTCLYAAAAVVLATKTFGKEAAIFADAASYRALFQRRFYLPQHRPTAAQALLLIAMLFPVWFYLQTGLGRLFEENLEGNLVMISLSMLALIAGAPILLAAYRKINLVNTFSWRTCSPRYLLGAMLIGLSAWALAHEIIVFQGVNEAMFDQLKPMADAIENLPFPVIWLVFALVPGVSEELLFRGFFLCGLRTVGRATALIIVGVVFGLFHFLLIRFAVTTLLGITLAYLCWQSRSLFPCILTHILHNTVSVSLPRLAEQFGFETISTNGHLPIFILIPAAIAFTAGIALFIKPAPEPIDPHLDSDHASEDTIQTPEPVAPA